MEKMMLWPTQATVGNAAQCSAEHHFLLANEARGQDCSCATEKGQCELALRRVD